MEPNLIPLSQLDPGHLEELAALHSGVMHTLLSELGRPVVQRYYQLAQKDASVLGIIALSDSDRLLGWAMGSPDPARLNSGLRQPLTWFAGQMLRLAFRRPGVLLGLLTSLLGTSSANQLAPKQVELTYIGVDRRGQGQGLGKSLLGAFCEQARQAGYQSVALSVETDNPAAMGLYTQGGFKITQTFREGHYERHRMELEL